MTFTVTPLGLAGLLEIRPHRISDERGFFSETWSSERFREAGLSLAFVQDNHSLSVAKGTLRGLHYQAPPREQDKLVRVARGAIFDVAVDIRPGRRPSRNGSASRFRRGSGTRSSSPGDLPTVS